MQNTVDVIIPINSPSKRLEYVLYQLSQQTVPIHEIILVERKTMFWDKLQISFPESLSVREVAVSEMVDQAVCWNVGMKAATAEFVLILSEDAIPCDENLVKILLGDFEKENTVLVYGRQLSGTELTKRERAMQAYLYPATPKKKSLEQFSKLGINLFFCSNDCAMYRRQTFEEQGFFLPGMLTHPESVWAADALYAGNKVCYEARARVQHSISRKGWNAFKYMFDMGVLSRSQISILGVPMESIRHGMRRGMEDEMLHLVQKIEKFSAKVGVKENKLLASLESYFENRQKGDILSAHTHQVTRTIREQIAFSHRYLMKNGGAGECIPLFGTGILMLGGWIMGTLYCHLPTWFCRLCSQNKSYWK